MCVCGSAVVVQIALETGRRGRAITQQRKRVRRDFLEGGEY